MNKILKIFKLFFLLFFVYSCGSVGEALQGKKRSDQGDEFLIDKKNPLTMPPDFDKLPKPGESVMVSTKDINEDESKIKNLLKKNTTEDISTSTDEPTSLESLILKEIN